MGYYNPMPMQMPNFYGRPQPMYQQMPQMPQINEQQFRQFAMTLNDNSLGQFAQLARMQGISEQDIQRGIQFIKSL